MNNIIVLTTGLSGSSFFVNLLSKNGFWAGDKTIFKNNFSGVYDTFENSALVKLNDFLLSEMKIDFNEQDQFNSKLFEQITDLVNTVNLEPFISFIDKCREHKPWIWKDPRMILTLGFWLKLLEEESCQFVYIYRNPFNLWISFINKRRLLSYSNVKNAEVSTLSKIKLELEKQGEKLNIFEFELAINDPNEFLKLVNEQLTIDINMVSFNSCFDSGLGKNNYSLSSKIKAIMIYIKNIYLVKR